MESFYGGRQGISFIIVAKYKTIEEMNNARSLISTGQYVAIFAENINDPDNGKLYIRSNRFVDEPFEYVGQIVGPQGDKLSDLVTYLGTEESIARGDEYKDTDKFSAIDREGIFEIDKGLVPGKDKDGTFNDRIVYKQVSIKDKFGHIYSSAVGFQIPYLVLEMATEAVKPYDNQGIYADTSSVKRTDDGSHPFYNKWTFDIPKGVHGINIVKAEFVQKEVKPIAGIEYYANSDDTVALGTFTEADFAGGPISTIYDEEYGINGKAKVGFKDGVYVKVSDCRSLSLGIITRDFDAKENGELVYTLINEGVDFLYSIKDIQIEYTSPSAISNGKTILRCYDYAGTEIDVIDISHVGSADYATIAGNGKYATRLEQDAFDHSLKLIAEEFDDNGVMQEKIISSIYNLQVRSITNEHIASLFPGVEL